MSEWELNIKVSRDESDILNMATIVITDLKTGQTYTAEKHEVTIHDLIPTIKHIALGGQ